MREFEGHKPSDKVEAHQERNVKDEIVKRQARMSIIKGLTTFQFNKKTQILQKAEFKESHVVMRDYQHDQADGRTLVKKIITKENCIYFQRLNFKNALRFLKKVGFHNVRISKHS